MAGNSAIWRDNNVEASSSDKIEFNEGTVPDNTANITKTEISLDAAIAVNTKPKGNLNELQDTGVDGVTWIITGSVEFPSTTGASQLVKEWLLDAKANLAFPKGRFGLRLDDFPKYNVRPNSNRGIMLQSWNWVRDGQWRGKVAFVAILRFNADKIGLNAGSSPRYNWDTV